MKLDLPVTHEIGGFIVGIDSGYRLFEVKRHREKKPIPAELSGKFTDVEAFESALAEYNSRQRRLVHE